MAAGLYGVALALVAVAGLGVLLARSPLTGRASWSLPLLGAGVAVLLSVRAVGVQALLLNDAGYGGGAVSPAQRWWTLLLWNPWSCSEPCSSVRPPALPAVRCSRQVDATARK